MKMDSPELVKLLEMANAMREAKGDKKLRDLPVSKRWVPNHCLIANAFNYKCNVLPSIRPSAGKILFRTKKDAETFCKITEANTRTIQEREIIFHPRIKVKGWQVDLPVELNSIARRFDRHAFPEYESKAKS